MEKSDTSGPWKIGAAGIVSEEKLKAFETELRELDREIRESAAEADKKLLRKRNELMEPVAAQLEEAIRTVALAEGYTFVLNAVDGSGVSVVLYGGEERDITGKVLEHLGIPKSPAK